MSIICCKKYFWLVRKGDFLLIKSHLWYRQNFSLRHQYNSKQTSNENKEKYQLGDYWLIQLQILQTNIIWIVWQTVRRVTQEILGVKGLTLKYLYISIPSLDFIIPVWSWTWPIYRLFQSCDTVMPWVRRSYHMPQRARRYHCRWERW